MRFSIWWDKLNPVTRIIPCTTTTLWSPCSSMLFVLLMGRPCRVTLPVLNCHPNCYSNHLQSSIECCPGCSYYHYYHHHYHHHQFLCLSSTEKEDLRLVATKFSALWRTATIRHVSRLHNRTHMIPVLFWNCTVIFGVFRYFIIIN